MGNRCPVTHSPASVIFGICLPQKGMQAYPARSVFLAVRKRIRAYHRGYERSTHIPFALTHYAGIRAPREKTSCVRAKDSKAQNLVCANAFSETLYASTCFLNEKRFLCTHLQDYNTYWKSVVLPNPHKICQSAIPRAQNIASHNMISNQYT